MLAAQSRINYTYKLVICLDHLSQLCLLLYTEQENQRRNYFRSENVKTNDKEMASDTLKQQWTLNNTLQ